jgi:putative ABC transport system permease protein
MKQKKPLTTPRIAINNLNGKPWMTFSLVTVVGILAFALFGGLVFSNSLNNGIMSLQARLGADIAVVPPGHEAEYENAILLGAPVNFYFDRDMERKIGEIENVGQSTSQFFLTSLDHPCCSEEVQIIGIDFDTDFVIKPWVSQVYDSRVGSGEMIVGANIFVADDGTLIFFGHEMRVAAHLAKTGTSMDNSVYVNMSTMHELAEAARRRGAIAEDLDIANSVSAVLVKVSPDKDIDTVFNSIRQNTPGAGVIKTQSIISVIAGNLSIVSGLIRIVAVILGVLAVMILAVLFAVFTLGRKKEFAVLRILGAERGKLARIVLSEAFIVSLCGGVLGIAAGALVVLPFSTYWGYKMSLPFLMPGMGKLAELTALALVMSAAAGSVSAAYSVYKVSRAETYATMREGE